jgi:hypothetical protein
VELLDKCRSQPLRDGNAAIGKLHHPSSRKLPSSVLNQACFYGVYLGFHSAKGDGNKAAIRTVGAGPLVRAACLASLSAFFFLQAIVASPFWCP